jgi:hypothetical protein
MSFAFNIRRSLRHWLARKLKPCREVVPLLSKSLDQRLALSERVEIRLHLLVCALCARYLKQIKFLRTVLRMRSEV